jgi:hypothetical protein
LAEEEQSHVREALLCVEKKNGGRGKAERRRMGRSRG